jgi:hypothetical protein
MRLPILTLAGFLAALAGATALAAEPAPEPPRISRPLEYSGYSSPEYRSFRTFSEYVMMSDGTKLAVDVHLPADGPERKAFPVIFEYTPYQRSTIDPETGRVSDAAGTTEGKFFLSYGYALVLADMRGTGASMGWLMDFMPRLSKDGHQLAQWIARQPWCDGHIGMSGSSYLGWSQMATASRAPRGLNCIMPECIPLDGYSGEAYPGGIFLEGFFKHFDEYMRLILLNKRVPGEGIQPAKPVDDEDHDGELKDEIPVDLNGDGTFLDESYPPTYRDGQSRKNLYYEATLAHQKGDYNYMEWAATRGFIDAPSPLGFTLYDLSPSAYVPGLMRSGMPVYHCGGWFDAFIRGTFELYCTMAGANPSKLIVGPSYHDFTSGPFWEHFGIPSETVERDYLIEHLRFYDRYVKNIDNGIEKEPPIYLYIMNGGGWRFENEWPIARQVMARLFCDADHVLHADRTQEGADAYTADATHDSRFGTNQGNRYLGIAGQRPDAPPIRTEKDTQCLAYTTDALSADTEVTGHPILHLWVSSTADDGDFFVYLEDVSETGEALLVTEGQLRAGFAALRNNSAMIKGGKYKIEVLPKLPWHGFEKKQYNNKVFARGAVVELAIDFNPTAWVFKQGRRIRVSIACADYPTFRLHPLLSPKNDPHAPDNVLPTITVYRNRSYASYLDLPVIPPAPRP